MATEQRLIDGNDVVDKLKKHHQFFTDAWGGFSCLPEYDRARVDEISNCIAEVLNSPTVDAVEVVRCKDCKNGYESSGSSTGMRCKKWGCYDTDCDCRPEDFCSYGERRE